MALGPISWTRPRGRRRAARRRRRGSAGADRVAGVGPRGPMAGREERGIGLLAQQSLDQRAGGGGAERGRTRRALGSCAISPTRAGSAPGSPERRPTTGGALSYPRLRLPTRSPDDAGDRRPRTRRRDRRIHGSFEAARNRGRSRRMKRAGRSPSSARKQFLCHFGGSRGSSAALAVQICGLRPSMMSARFAAYSFKRQRGIGASARSQNCRSRAPTK